MEGSGVGTRATLDVLFRPRAIAVVGASREAGKVGHDVTRNLFLDEFRGPVYPVNPNAGQVMCTRAYASLDELPESVDLVVSAVPRALLPQIAEQCGDTGARALVVLTSGLSSDAEGAELAERLLVATRRAGVLLVGPGSMGVLHAEEGVRLNATLGGPSPPAGAMSIASQTAQLGLKVLDRARREGHGVRSFLCVGSGAGIGPTDLLEHWRDDEGTELVLLLVPRFGEPRRFPSVARETSRKKPIVAVKSGGRRVVGALDGRRSCLLSGVEVDPAELVAQCGIVRLSTVAEIFDVTRAFASLPLPAGDRVIILANAAGPAALAREACDTYGLRAPAIGAETRRRLKSCRPTTPGEEHEPVMLHHDAGADAFAGVLSTLLAEEGTDAAIVVCAPGGPDGVCTIGESVALVAERQAEKPVLFAVAGAGEGTAADPAPNEPAYDDPAAAVRALGALRQRARWLSASPGELAHFDVRSDAATDLIRRKADQGGGFLSELERNRVLAAYGIQTPRGRSCRDADEAVTAAENLGYPVVMKLSRVDLIDKRDSNAVILGPSNELEVRGAFTKLADVSARVFGERRPTVLVQEFIRGGVETVVGMVEDGEFGPLVVFGLGGLHLQVHRDLACHITPVTDVEARAMIASVRAHALLLGERPSGDEGEDGPRSHSERSLVDAIQRVSQMVTELPDVEALELNPLRVFPEDGRTVAVDARVRVREAAPGGKSLLDVL